MMSTDELLCLFIMGLIYLKGFCIVKNKKYKSWFLIVVLAKWSRSIRFETADALASTTIVDSIPNMLLLDEVLHHMTLYLWFPYCLIKC